MFKLCFFLAFLSLSLVTGLAVPNIIGAPPQVANAMAIGSVPYRDGIVYQYSDNINSNAYPIYVARYHARIPADSILSFSGASPNQMKNTGQIAEWNLYSLESANLGDYHQWRFASQEKAGWVFLVYCPEVSTPEAANFLADFAQFLSSFSAEDFLHAGIRSPTDSEVLAAIDQLKLHWRADPYSLKEDDAYKRNRQIMLTYAKDNQIITSMEPYREWMDPLAFYLEQRTLQLAYIAGVIAHTLNNSADGEAMIQVLYHPLNATGYTEDQLNQLRSRLVLSEITNHLNEIAFPVGTTNFTPWSQLSPEVLKQVIRQQMVSEKTTFKQVSYQEQFFADLPQWQEEAAKGYYYSSINLQTNLHQLDLVPIYSRWLNSPLDPDELLTTPPAYAFLNYLNPTTTEMTNVPDALIFIDRGWKRIAGGNALPLGYRQQQNKVWIISPKHELLATLIIMPPVPHDDQQTNLVSTAIRVLPMSDQELLDALWKRLRLE